MNHARDETGAVLVLTAALLVALASVVGLAVEFTVLSVASDRADSEAEAAAVRAVDALSEDVLRRGAVDIDRQAAQAAGREWLTAHQLTGTPLVVSTGRCEAGLPPPCWAVQVTVSSTERLRFLSGEPVRVTGRGQAAPYVAGERAGP